MRLIFKVLATAVAVAFCGAAPSAAEEASVIAPAVGGDRQAPPATAAPFVGELALCPHSRVSNAPAADENGRVQNYARVVNVNGVALAIDPAQGACLSSGFGRRRGHLHKGLDFYSDVRVPILAAGDGVIIERAYRSDYGNMLLIDHGGGVFTRYAHLARFDDGMVVGARISAGQEIGLMGNTARRRVPIHLHYEILLGDYANPSGSFGLTPHSPFEFPPQGEASAEARLDDFPARP